jgi:hypothetical protein
MAASLAQNEQVVAALSLLATDLKKEAMIEDVLCAIYSKPNPVGLIQKYILAEDDPANELAIQTALNALAFKVPEASYKHSIKAMMAMVKVKWKQDLLGQMYEDKIAFGYGISSGDSLVTKVWDGYTVSHYLNGNLISIGEFLEFDPN